MSENKIKIPKEAKLTASQRLKIFQNGRIAGAALSASLIEGRKGERFDKQHLKACTCGRSLFIDDKNTMIKQTTCKKRWCTSCARYKAFERDLGFYPSIKKIVDANKKEPKKKAGLWLVTLTLPTCPYDKLAERLVYLQKEWAALYNMLKKESSKGYMNGLRKLEIETSPKKGIKNPKTYKDYNYHAHLHVLIQGLGNANYLKRNWLRRNPQAKKWAQNIKPFDTKKGTLVELLKYLAKPPSKMDSAAIHAKVESICFVYRKLMGRRTIFSYGSVKQVKDKEELKKAYEDAPKKQKERIEKFLSYEGSKASRPLESSYWWFNGWLYEDEKGKKLCEEKEVRQADQKVHRIMRKLRKEAEAQQERYKKERERNRRLKHLKDKCNATHGFYSKDDMEMIWEEIEKLKREKEREIKEYKRKERSQQE